MARGCPARSLLIQLQLNVGLRWPYALSQIRCCMRSMTASCDRPDWVRLVSLDLARSVVSLILVLVACNAGRIVNVSDDSRSRTVFAAVGQEIRIPLGNVGPALYESPPQMSSNAISFLGVDVIPPFNPGGPTQQFRFEAVRKGTAVIHFRRLLGDAVVFVVDDTVQIY